MECRILEGHLKEKLESPGWLRVPWGPSIQVVLASLTHGSTRCPPLSSCPPPLGGPGGTEELDRREPPALGFLPGAERSSSFRDPVPLRSSEC